MSAHAGGTAPPRIPNPARRGFGDRLRQIRYRAALAYYRLCRAAGGPDYLAEITFWEEILSQRPSSLFDRRVREAAFPPELRDCAAELRRDSVRLPRLLELGSGPVSILASGSATGLLPSSLADRLPPFYRFSWRSPAFPFPF